MIDDRKILELLQSADPLARELAGEIQRLRAAIFEHKSASGHELCWLNDVELWRAVDARAAYPHGSLPVREEFLGQCARYFQSRVKGTSYEEPAVKKNGQRLVWQALTLCAQSNLNQIGSTDVAESC